MKTLKVQEGSLLEKAVKKQPSINQLSIEFARLKREVNEIYDEHQLTQKEEQLKVLSKQIGEWLGANKKDSIRAKDGTILDLTERRKAFWVLDTRDIPQNVPILGKIKPLRKVLRDWLKDDKEQYSAALNAITRRVVDNDALDDYLRGMHFKSDKEKNRFYADLTKAYVDYVETRYVRAKFESDDDGDGDN